MPTSLVAAAVTAFGWLAGETVLAFVARTVLFTGISRIIAKRSLSQSNSAAASGRTQQAPVANNVLPVVYGTAFIPPTVTDAKISTDQKYMWYVCALAEHTDTTVSSGYTFGDIYYDGKLVTFDGTDTSKVTKLTTNGDTPQEDTNIAGKLYIWKFPNGSTSGISTGGSNAITLLSDSSTGGGIPAGERWNGPIYTYTEGLVTYSPTMSNTAFIVIRVEYNEDAGLSGLGQVQVELTNTITKPGDALKDYLLNSRYGCAVPLAKIDTASLTALNTYSDELVTYTPVGGGSATQVRYRINGPLDPANDCLTNLQQLVDACDSWLQYSELTGTWGVVINQSYTDYTTLNDLFLVDSSNLIGGINVNPIDLNSIYNEMEVQYPDYNVQDQYNFPVIKLQDYYPQWMSPNEPVNRINLNYPQVNNNIQARYLGVRRLLQGRLDLTVNFTLDYSGIQLVAGDVIKINLAEYGWGPTTLDPSNPSQLFRVSNVQEQKNQDGNLFAVITAFQYDDDVYNDDPLTDFVLDGNTGLSDPNIISQPSTPVITTGAVANGATRFFTVSSNVPASGSVLYMDFNVGTSSNVLQHKSFSTVQIGDGTPYTANSNVTINVSDLNANTYYWSSTARNKQARRQSNSSNSYVWPGPSVSNFNANTNVGGITFAQSGLDAGGAQIVTIYAVNNQRTGVVTLPVSALTNPTINVPKIYTGTAPNVNYIWPYGQGTVVATYPTTPGYGVASTAPFLPVDSALYAMPFSAYGNDDYYLLISVDLTQTIFTTSEIIVTTAAFQLYTDTPGTDIMIVPFASFVAAGPIDYIQTQFASFYRLDDAFPYVLNVALNQVDTPEGDAFSVGYYIKVLTTGAQVTCVNGSMATKQQRPYTGSITL
jgi:hypothetical protein